MTDHLKKHTEGTHNYCGICNKGLFLVAQQSPHKFVFTKAFS